MRKLFIAAGLSLLAYNSGVAQVTYPVNGVTDPKHIVYAFINARIHPDPATVIDSAVMLVKDGRVDAVGRNISIPKEAIVFDLKGKNIYPSFIDIFSDYGLPEVKKSKPDENPQLLSNTKGAYDWNQSVKPETDASRMFSTDTKKAEEFRKLGFGTVMSVYRDGIVRGTSVLALLGDGKENDLILSDRAAANYSFNSGSSSQDYPSSLMGAIALLRQTYLDADWYRTGGYKKEFNISLDAFNKQRDLPQIFEAGDKQNELRADKIGDEFGVSFIIKGSGNEYARINEIKNTGCSFIVPLNFPEAYDLSDPYEASNLSMQQLKEWELAPLNPAAMAGQSIPFAFTTSDLKNKNDFIKNLRKAIESGLSEQEALKALTTTPAKLLRADDQIGSLKKGMLANFIITSKNFTDKDNVIFENWIKGIRYKFADIQTGDVRGNYSLTGVGSKVLRMKIGGEFAAPEVIVFDDTLNAKASFSRQGSSVTLQVELKTNTPKGIYRLNGTINDSTKLISGNVLLPSGTWSKWSARFDSVFIVPPVKKDSIQKVLDSKGPVLFPNMAYGWKEFPDAKSFVIRNATVWTNENSGILQQTDVYVVNGKIKQIGKSLTVPAGTISVDGTGKHLTSGIIDEHSHIAVSGSVNEGTQASSAEVRIGDVVDGDDINVYRQLAGGVTISHLLHGSANPIGGQTQIIKLRWGRAPEQMKLENGGNFIKFALGENVKQSHWGDKQVVRFPQTRMGVEQVYLDYFTRASEYASMLTHEVSLKKTPGYIPVRSDLELDALVEIIKSKRFITCHSYVQSEINMLMHIADTFGFKVNTFTHILEGYKVADKMKAHGVRGVSTFSDWWAYKFEVYEAIPYNGALMHRMGLNVSFNSDDAEMARRLNQEAAKAVEYGNVSEEEAWKFVTLNPAKMLRIEDRVGSIKEGKDADLVLWTDNPLSIYAKTVQTYVDGIPYFDSTRDVAMRAEMKTEKARIMQRMTEAKNKGESVQKPGMRLLELKGCLESEFLWMK